MSRTHRILLVSIFGLSGAVGIAYEVLWLRVFTHLTGSGVQSVSAVVTAFLLGLAIGGAVFGRAADRARSALRLYAALELLVGGGHVLAFWAFGGVDPLYAALWSRVPWPVLQWLIFGLAALVVTVPAALLGGTLPALLRHFAVRERTEAAQGAGRLYAINTLGAGVGALALAHGLLPSIGYGPSIAVSAAMSIALGLLALALAKDSNGEEVTAAPAGGDAEPGVPIPAHLVLFAYAASGFAALGYEVVWSRLLEYLFHGRLVCFAYLLLAFLGGLAIGNLSGARLLRTRADPRVVMGALCVASGIAALDTLLLVVFGQIGFHVFAGIVVTAMLVGATFPVALRLRFEGLAWFGRTVGSVYAWNTAGSIVGAFAAGFVLVPLLGSQRTWIALAALHVLAGVAVLARSSRPRLAVWGGSAGALAVAVCAMLLAPDALVRACYSPSHGRLLYAAENQVEVLAVFESSTGARSLFGGPQLSGSTSRRSDQIIQGHLAMLLHPHPERVLEIGYGVGDILRAVNRHAPAAVDLVEIDPQMVPVANEWFSKVNARSSEEPHVSRHFLDGRHWLAMTDHDYDVILSDTFFILSEGSTRLYTLEHFQNGANRLRPGGHMVVWLPLNMGDDRVAIVCRTFRRVFPHVLAWRAGSSLFLIGSAAPLDLRLDRLLERFERCSREDLELVGIDRLEDFLCGFEVAAPELDEAFPPNEGPLHLDLRPVLDFAPLGRWNAESPLNRAFQRGSARVILPLLDAEGARFVADATARYEEAERILEATRLRTVPPGQPEWTRKLDGISAADAGEAIATIESALRVCPGHRQARLLGAEICRQVGFEAKDPAERLAWLQRSLGFFPLDPFTNLLLGLHWLAQGDRARAKACLVEGRRAQPYLQPDPDSLGE